MFLTMVEASILGGGYKDLRKGTNDHGFTFHYLFLSKRQETSKFLIFLVSGFGIKRRSIGPSSNFQTSLIFKSLLFVNGRGVNAFVGLFSVIMGVKVSYMSI